MFWLNSCIDNENEKEYILGKLDAFITKRVEYALPLGLIILVGVGYIGLKLKREI